MAANATRNEVAMAEDMGKVLSSKMIKSKYQKCEGDKERKGKYRLKQ